MSRFVVVGDVVTDVLAVQHAALAYGSDTAADIRITGGGSAANTAAWLAAHGADVTLCGVVGDDSAGSARLAELVAVGVHTEGVRRAVGAPTGSIVVLSDGTERTMLCDRGANALLSPADIDTALRAVPDAGHLHLSGYVFFDARSAPAGRHALAAARAHGLSTSVDAASAAPLRRLGAAVFADWVHGVDLLFANLDEARVLAGTDDQAAELAEALLHVAPEVVVKCGDDGAVWAGPSASRRSLGPIHEPAERVSSAVEPTGAGDAFAAGFLRAWCGGASPAVALRAGVTLGARAVGQLGGRPLR